jgi:glutathione S-transferase
MIIVHHLDKSRSHRILWLLEELGIQYEIKNYKRNAETMLAPPELKQIHPLGKSPVIENTETKELVAESGAIVEVSPSIPS